MTLKLMNKMYFLHSPEGEAGGGASGENVENKVIEGAGDSNDSVVISPEEVKAMKAELETLRKVKDEILGEKKAEKEARLAAEKRAADLVKETAEKSGDIKALYEIEMAANKELMAKLDIVEKEKMTEAELRNAEKQKVVKTQMFNAFLKEVGSELHDAELAFSLVDSTKFILDEKGKYGFNEKGMKVLADEFRSKHSYLIKSDNKTVPGHAASSTGEDLSKLSFAERAKKAGLANF